MKWSRYIVASVILITCHLLCQAEERLKSHEGLVQNKSWSPYVIIIDGGSTGSRLHIFEFVPRTDVQSSVDAIDSFKCMRRGSQKVRVPLSTYGRTEDDTPLEPSAVASHLLPLFEFAADQIPVEYHADTIVKYEATAGMRLLSHKEQEAVYDALFLGLQNSVLSSEMPFPFISLERSDIGTLSGSDEGYFGVLATNFLGGFMDEHLRLSSSGKPLGSLDMGGSSTQIVFSPTGMKASLEVASESLFFAKSYLSYGADQFRETMWNMWIRDFVDVMEDIQNPCGFVNYRVEWNGRSFIGTGDVDACVVEIRRLIPNLDGTEQNYLNNLNHVGTRVGGFNHPKPVGKFIGMSLYYFCLDALRVLSSSNELEDAWPTPTLHELQSALYGLCKRRWDGDLDVLSKSDFHKYTRSDILPDRCFEAVYIVTLLRDGFGFDPNSRDIMYLYDIDGSEVEWTLGMALSLFAEEYKGLKTAERVKIINRTTNSLCESSSEACTNKAVENLLSQ